MLTKGQQMARVRSKNSQIELEVRKKVFAAGFRFTIHSSFLPGKPDLVLPRFRIAVFVNGCFWHGHLCRRGALPASRKEFWEQKIKKNRARDAKNYRLLKQLGWKPVVVWGCKLDQGTDRLISLLTSLRN